MDSAELANSHLYGGELDTESVSVFLCQGRLGPPPLGCSRHLSQCQARRARFVALTTSTSRRSRRCLVVVCLAQPESPHTHHPTQPYPPHAADTAAPALDSTAAAALRGMDARRIVGIDKRRRLLRVLPRAHVSTTQTRNHLVAFVRGRAGCRNTQPDRNGKQAGPAQQRQSRMMPGRNHRQRREGTPRSSSERRT